MFPRRRDGESLNRNKYEREEECHSLRTAIHERCEVVLSILTSNLLGACCQAAHIEATCCDCRVGLGPHYQLTTPGFEGN